MIYEHIENIIIVELKANTRYQVFRTTNLLLMESMKKMIIFGDLNENQAKKLERKLNKVKIKSEKLNKEIRIKIKLK